MEFIPTPPEDYYCYVKKDKFKCERHPYHGRLTFEECNIKCQSNYKLAIPLGQSTNFSNSPFFWIGQFLTSRTIYYYNYPWPQEYSTIFKSGDSLIKRQFYDFINNRGEEKGMFGNIASFIADRTNRIDQVINLVIGKQVLSFTLQAAFKPYDVAEKLQDLHIPITSITEPDEYKRYRVSFFDLTNVGHIVNQMNELERFMVKSFTSDEISVINLSWSYAGIVASHSNTILINSKTKTIYYFEPHGGINIEGNPDANPETGSDIRYNIVKKWFYRTFDKFGIRRWKWKGNLITLQGNDELCKSWSLFIILFTLANPIIDVGDFMKDMQLDENKGFRVALLAMILFRTNIKMQELVKNPPTIDENSAEFKKYTDEHKFLVTPENIEYIKKKYMDDNYKLSLYNKYLLYRKIRQKYRPTYLVELINNFDKLHPVIIK